MEGADVMSQFMDVITTFKCKGCDYVCHKQEDLISHVKTVHMPPTVVQQVSESDASVSTASSTTTSDNNQTAAAVSSTISTTSHSAISSSSGLTSEVTSGSIIADLVDATTGEGDNFIDVGSNLQQINIQTYAPDGTPTDQVVLVEGGINAASSALFSNQVSEQQQQKEVFLCGHCNLGYQSIEACKDHMVKDHQIDINDLSTSTPDDLDVIGDVQSQSSSSVTSSANTVSTATGTDTTDVGVALSDQSALVADGKASNTISEREEMPDGKVSMSTQVIRKKVGRKSKAELQELAAAREKENQQAAASADGAGNDEDSNSGANNSSSTAVKLDGELDDEFEDAIAIYVEIEVPGKRKRRLPKHLTKDYLISKKAKHVLDDHGSNVSVRNKVPKPSVKKLKLDTPFKCDSCRAKFVDEEQLVYHTSTHSDMKNSSGLPYFVCPEEDCKELKFQTVIWTEFKHHAWKEHKLDLGMIPCDLCDYKATVPSKLAIHKEIHRADKPYICDICHKGFKQQSQLKNHSLVHVAGMDIKEKESMSGRHWFVQAQCNICKRTFANQKSLQCHVEAVHDKVKPFSCKFCGHTAARKAMMQLHMRTHTGEKPFKCDQCDYQTGDHNSMRRHKMRHTGDKPYQCPHCAYACIQAVSLKLHLKSKHPGSESFYSCNKCAYRSVNKTLFSNHMRDHEIGLIDEVDMIPVSDNTSAAPVAAQPGFAVKLGPITDLTNGTSNTTQLICSALNAITPTLTDDGEPLPDNIETTVSTISNDGGIRAHKITFHIPATATKNAKTAEVVVQEHVPQVPVTLPAVQTMDPLQAATIESEIPTDELAMDDDTNDVTPDISA